MRIFVCHASEDKAAVAALCGMLTAEGIECWFDVESLNPGDEWEMQIRKAIRRSQAVLVCLSARAIAKKTFLKREIDLILAAAESQARPSNFVFPVLLERCAIPRRLSRWQAVDISHSDAPGALLRSLREMASTVPGIRVPGDHATEAEWREPLIREQLPEIVDSTRSYERWLKSLTPLIAKNRSIKHDRMSLSPFTFFRGTFYRWAEAWPVECPDLARAPMVVSAGDVSISSFGTWLDSAGRLGWGLTTMDEAYPLPYTNDLIRLTTSVAVAAATVQTKLAGGLKRMCETVLSAYRKTLQRGGAPIVLGAKYSWLYELTFERRMKPPRYWERFGLKSRYHRLRAVPVEVHEALERVLPIDATFSVLAHSAGVGNVDRPRFLAVAQWQGGPVGAVASYIPPPAAAWAAGVTQDVPNFHNRILATARRTPNLRSGVWKGVFVRQIGPEIGGGLDVTRVMKKKIFRKLIRACATEVANVHAGTPGGQARVLQHLDTLPPDWLQRASEIMMSRNEADFLKWRSSFMAKKSQKAKQR